MTIAMKPQPEPSTQEVLAGLVERVTYHNAENGFCVLRAKARGHRVPVTVVGHSATIAAGEWITASGEWINDRTHGQQFKARFLRTSPPTSADGIEKYLSSGMIRGVKPLELLRPHLIGECAALDVQVDDLIGSADVIGAEEGQHPMGDCFVFSGCSVETALGAQLGQRRNHLQGHDAVAGED
jgi:hypothetical protein